MGIATMGLPNVAISKGQKRSFSGSSQLRSASGGQAQAQGLAKADSGVALEAKLSHTPTSRLEVSVPGSFSRAHALQGRRLLSWGILREFLANEAGKTGLALQPWQGAT